MTGFAHDIAGGNGVLIITALKSPDYAAGVSGWAVMKNGDAEFNQGIFRGTLQLASGESIDILGSHISPHGTDADIYGIPATGPSASSFLILASPADGTQLAAIELAGESEDNTVLPYVHIYGTDSMGSQYAIPLWLAGRVLTTDPASSSSAESWHAISLTGGPSGITGTARVKMLAESNFACLDIEVSYPALTAQGTYTIGALPSAVYYPAASRHFAGGIAGTATGSPQPRVFLGTSGGVQLVDLPAGSSGFGLSQVYPLD